MQDFLRKHLWPTNKPLKIFMTYKQASEKFHDLQTCSCKISWPANMPLEIFMTYKSTLEKFHDLHPPLRPAPAIVFDRSHVSGTTYRRKIVLDSIFVQSKWYFLSFFSNIDDKLVKNKKRLKKAIAFFSGGPHCSEMAYHAISTFGPLITRIQNFLWKSIFLSKDTT